MVWVPLVGEPARVPFEYYRRLLGRLSGGRNLNLGGSPDGRPELTSADIAAAIGCVQRRTKTGELVEDALAVSLLLYLWAGMDSERERAARQLLLPLSTWAAQEKWRLRGPGWLRSLAKMALYEITARKVCTHCSATGGMWQPGYFDTEYDEETDMYRRVWRKGKVITCSRCEGRGVFSWSLRQRVAAVSSYFGEDVSLTAWVKSWDGRYEKLLAFIDSAQQRGLGQLRKALQGIREAS